MALQVDNFSAHQRAEITPLERSKPAHRVAIADTVEVTTHVDRRASIPITHVRSHFRLGFVVEHAVQLCRKPIVETTGLRASSRSLREVAVLNSSAQGNVGR